jgi:hypothetical protein
MSLKGSRNVLAALNQGIKCFVYKSATTACITISDMPTSISDMPTSISHADGILKRGHPQSDHVITVGSRPNKTMYTKHCEQEANKHKQHDLGHTNRPVIWQIKVLPADHAWLPVVLCKMQ